MRFIEDILKEWKEESIKKKELKQKLKKIREEGREERLIAVEIERQKSLQRHEIAELRKPPEKRNKNSLGGFSVAFDKFRDYAADITQQPGGQNGKSVYKKTKKRNNKKKTKNTVQAIPEIRWRI